MMQERQLPGIQAEDDLDIRVLMGPANTAVVPAEPQSDIWSEAKSLMRDVIIACLIAFFIIFFVVRPVRVEGESMMPKLNDRDRIFVNQILYPYREFLGDKQPIKRGDIVVLYYPMDPSKSYIKRVIGLPGEDIAVEDGKLYVNGVLQNEPYLSSDAVNHYQARAYSGHVEEHHYLVLGDNRNNSSDSRDWGMVPERYIYGKAMFRYYSPNNWFKSIGSLQ